MKSLLTKSLFFILILCLSGLFAAEVVVEGNIPNKLAEAIVAASAGDVLLLEAGKTYPNQGTVTIDKELIIKSTGDIATLGKPIVRQIANTGGTYDQRTFEIKANFTFINIHFVGETLGPDDPMWSREHIRTLEPDIIAVMDNCIFFKAQTASVRFNKATTSISITNCLFVDDNLTATQGNGRAIDFREGPHGKVLIQNNTITNTLDRFIRHLWWAHWECPPIDSLIIDHNTFTQNLGYRTPFQFSSVKYLQFTNNIVVNPVMLGTDTISQRVNDEITWTNPDVVTYVGPQAICVFAVTQADSFGTQIVMNNNNVYLESSVDALYAGSDRLSRAPMYNNEMKALISPATATFEEVLTFGKASATHLPSVEEYVVRIDTLSEIGAGIVLTNNFEFRLDFPYAELDLTYGTDAKSYTAADGGFPLGDLNWYPDKKAEWENWTPPAMKTCAFLSKEAAPGEARDRGLISYLGNTYDVTVLKSGDVKSGAVTPADLEAYDFVFSSETPSSGDLAPLKAIDVPVYTLEGWAVKPAVLGFSSGSGTNQTTGKVTFTNEAGGHYLAAGNAPGSEVELVTGSASDWQLISGAPGVVHTPISVMTPDAAAIVSYGVETGTALYKDDGSAIDPALVTKKRAAVMGVHADAYGFLTADFYTLIDAGIEWVLDDGSTAIEPVYGNAPQAYDLAQNYPNPFNPSTTVSFSLPVSGKVMLEVYDILGHRVETLINESMNAGSHTYEFDGSKLSSGVYFYRINVDNKFNQTKKMILMK